jgi:hypothetical protein
MEWAVVLEGRPEPEGILLVLPERPEAESIASEIRKKGHAVVVRPYRDTGTRRDSK